ncbi:hypothetical protein BCR35DRAFT_263641, partial [Leucosporidium creatinivorum]
DDEFDSSYDALLRLSERLGDVKPKGVPADKVSSLAVFKYAEWPMPTRSANHFLILQDYEDDEDVMLGRCNHGFHRDCFAAWLKEHGTCP